MDGLGLGPVCSVQGRNRRVREAQRKSARLWEAADRGDRGVEQGTRGWTF